MNTPSRRRWIPIAAAAAVLFYLGVYFWGAHSEGFHFLSDTIARSSAIQRRVGDVQSVRMSFFGGYRERFVGDNIQTTMILNVTGNRGSATVNATAKKTSGAWSVSNASIDGQPVALN